MQVEMCVIITIVVGILAILQGWQMFMARKKKNGNSNPGNPTVYLEKMNEISSGISAMNTKLNKLDGMKQRLDDIWDKVRIL